MANPIDKKARKKIEELLKGMKDLSGVADSVREMTTELVKDHEAGNPTCQCVRDDLLDLDCQLFAFYQTLFMFGEAFVSRLSRIDAHENVMQSASGLVNPVKSTVEVLADDEPGPNGAH